MVSVCNFLQLSLPATSADAVFAFKKRTKQVYDEQVGFRPHGSPRAQAEAEALGRATSRPGGSTPVACYPLAVLKVPLQFSAAVNLTQQMENVDVEKKRKKRNAVK